MNFLSRNVKIRHFFRENLNIRVRRKWFWVTQDRRKSHRFRCPGSSIDDWDVRLREQKGGDAGCIGDKFSPTSKINFRPLSRSQQPHFCTKLPQAIKNTRDKLLKHKVWEFAAQFSFPLQTYWKFIDRNCILFQKKKKLRSCNKNKFNNIWWKSK